MKERIRDLQVRFTYSSPRGGYDSARACKFSWFASISEAVVNGIDLDDSERDEDILLFLETLFEDMKFAERALEPIAKELEELFELRDYPKFSDNAVHQRLNDAKHEVNSLLKRKDQDSAYVDTGSPDGLREVLKLLDAEEKNLWDNSAWFSNRKKELKGKIRNYVKEEAGDLLLFTIGEVYDALHAGRASSKGFGPNFCIMNKTMGRRSLSKWALSMDYGNVTEFNENPDAFLNSRKLLGCDLILLENVPRRYIEFKYLPHSKSGPELAE